MSTLILTGKIAGTAALAIGAAFTGVHAFGAATAEPASATAKPACVSDALRADLKSARKAVHTAQSAKQRSALKQARRAVAAKPAGAQRLEARAQLAKDVASGTYGDAVERLAELSAKRQDACRDQRTQKTREARAERLTAAAAKAADQVPDGVTCDRVAVSSELKEARQAARAKPKGKERRAALRSLHRAVLAGTYGDAAKSAAAAAKAQRATAPKVSDADRAKLKAAHRAATAEPKGTARTSALKALRQDVLKGTYGEALQQRATRAQQHHAACRADRLQQRADKATAAAKG